jgi:uncharacterized protein (TIGR02147 family)
MKTKGHYRDILKEELQSRMARNAAYSLRAFARDLELSPASLSLVMNGKQGLSRIAAERIVDRIGFHFEEKEYFCNLVDREHARSKKAKNRAKKQLEELDHQDTVLNLETFRAMSDWYYFAILELTSLDKFKKSPGTSQWIANQLGLSVGVVDAAIERMKKIGFLEVVNGKLQQSVGFLATPSGIPSAALRNYHQQILVKATQAVSEQSVEERDLSAIVLTMSKSDMDWAREEIKKFRRSLMERLEQNPKRDEVYCLAVQLFSLEKAKPK